MAIGAGACRIRIEKRRSRPLALDECEIANALIEARISPDMSAYRQLRAAA